ncbi:MAG TPA: DUF1439 domain-containing protein [Spirochaetes bacterium]|nr:DUF1439 domain-containing protein [Spirochaetota bacterium]
MKKVFILVVTALIIVLAGVYYFSGKEYVIRLSESYIQGKLEEKLPRTKTYFLIIQITLKNPRVHLKHGSNRINAGLDVVFNIRLKKTPKPLEGAIDISGGVIYVAEKSQFFLTNPVIEKLTIQGITSKYTNIANKSLTKALAKYYRKNPIYTLRPTDIKKTITKMVLKKVMIENKELILTLGI